MKFNLKNFKNVAGIFLIMFFVLSVLTSPSVSLAQGGGMQSGNGGGGMQSGGSGSGSGTGGTGISVKIINPISDKATTINGFIKILLEGVLRIGIPIVALAIIYCGFLFVSAQGNTEKLKTAKESLLYTIIGAAILLGSWAIAQLITETVIAL